MARIKYATGFGLKRHHGRWHITNAWANAHPRAFRCGSWRGGNRKTKPVWLRRRIDRNSGITSLLSGKDPYNGVTLFRHVLAERVQSQRIARLPDRLRSRR